MVDTRSKTANQTRTDAQTPPPSTAATDSGVATQRDTLGHPSSPTDSLNVSIGERTVKAASTIASSFSRGSRVSARRRRAAELAAAEEIAEMEREKLEMALEKLEIKQKKLKIDQELVRQRLQVELQSIEDEEEEFDRQAEDEAEHVATKRTSDWVQENNTVPLTAGVGMTRHTPPAPLPQPTAPLGPTQYLPTTCATATASVHLVPSASLPPLTTTGLTPPTPQYLPTTCATLPTHLTDRAPLTPTAGAGTNLQTAVGLNNMSTQLNSRAPPPAPTLQTPLAPPHQPTALLAPPPPAATPQTPDYERDERDASTDARSDMELLARELRRLSSNKDRCCTSKLPEFAGATNDWLAFKAAYEEQARRFDKVENLARLRRCLRGDAKATVSHQLLTDGDPDRIMKLLGKKYGRDHDLVIHQLRRVHNLPTITDIPRQINDFACTVEDVVATLSSMRQERYLHSIDAVQAIKAKMRVLMHSYADYAHSNREEDKPELTMISQFLEAESEKITYAWAVESRDVAVTADARVASRPTNARPPAPAQQREPRTQAVHASITESAAACLQCAASDHAIHNCGKFKALSQDEKWNVVTAVRACFRCLKSGHRSQICRSKQGCTVNGCGRRHHTLLHKATPEPARPPTTSSEANVESSACARGSQARALLMIVPVTIYGPKGSTRTHALLDSGATTTLIKTELADRVGAAGPTERLTLAETTTTGTHTSRLVDLEISGPTNSKYPLWGAFTVDKLQLIAQTVPDCSHLPHLRDLPLRPYADVVPEVVVGQNNFHLLAERDRRTAGLGWESPSAIRTLLGWVLTGSTGGSGAAGRRRGQQSVHFVGHLTRDDEELHDLVRQHYDLDALGVSEQKREKPADRRAILILEETCRRTENDRRWEAGLLWRSDATTMPPSKGAALKRLRSLERKMDANKDFGEAYARQMQHLIDAGYARPVAPITDRRLWYLPHFAVTNPNKPGKLRIVFDAAARVDGRSLNDALLTGPDMLQSLLGVLFRFREGPVAVSADIREMFLRVQITPADRPAQRFFWRGLDRHTPPEEYEMSSMIFGAASSPTTAIYVKNKNAAEFAHTYPEAAMAIERQFYMDDYLQSFTSVAEAMKIAEQVKQINARGGFELTGWASNDTAVTQHLDPGSPQQDARTLDLHAAQEKTLGLRWDPRDDTLGFNLSLARIPSDIASGDRRPTKRQMLAVVMSVFDPLGLLAPVIIQAKIILQRVWRSAINWDDELADAEAVQWFQWLLHLRSSWTCRIPRCYCARADTLSVELHTFCDASEDAYAAVAYLRFALSDGRVHTSIVASKTRVAPLKPASIPRLELQAALLGCRLAATIASEHALRLDRRCYWTDSRTVLAWIRSDPREYHAFVSHRLGEIDELSSAADWRWVNTMDNVADDATRAQDEFDTDHRWFVGPAFLRRPESEWPTQPDDNDATTEERKSKTETVAATNATPTTDCLPDASRFSSWTRLVRTTAYVLLFVEKCRRRHADDALERRHMDAAEKMLLKRVQEDSFGNELRDLRAHRKLAPSSRLQHLSPYADSDGLLRLRGRASATPGITKDAAEPVILCGRHRITRLLVHHHHVLAHHAYPEAVVNHLRQRYWVLHLRPTVRAVEHACQACRVRRATALAPPMGDLPVARLQHHHRPFTFCGLDYFGPLDVTVGRRREKRYGALFTCLVTRAVHVEIAHSLTTDSAICALRRMIARRGVPAEVHTDNGTNFHGADVELRRAWAELDQGAIRVYAMNRGTKWRFIPPAAPFMGGAWERLVGSIKKALGVTLHQRAPTDEVLATLLAEAEHCVNSRPLTHVSTQPGDPESLTPNHFLLGSSSGAPTPGVFDDADLVRRRPWRAAQRLADIFWARWVREYLPTLLPRPLPGDGRPELCSGDVVLIVDGNLPRNVWPRGVVERVLPGKDGHVRVADVRTVGGLLRRPTRKLVRLPTERVDEDDRGENVDDGTSSHAEQ